jgi:hypothetical protein
VAYRWAEVFLDVDDNKGWLESHFAINLGDGSRDLVSLAMANVKVLVMIKVKPKDPWIYASTCSMTTPTAEKSDGIEK